MTSREQSMRNHPAGKGRPLGIGPNPDLDTVDVAAAQGAAIGFIIGAMVTTLIAVSSQLPAILGW